MLASRNLGRATPGRNGDYRVERLQQRENAIQSLRLRRNLTFRRRVNRSEGKSSSWATDLRNPCRNRPRKNRRRPTTSASRSSRPSSPDGPAVREKNSCARRVSSLSAVAPANADGGRGSRRAAGDPTFHDKRCSRTSHTLFPDDVRGVRKQTASARLQLPVAHRPPARGRFPKRMTGSRHENHICSGIKSALL